MSDFEKKDKDLFQETEIDEIVDEIIQAAPDCTISDEVSGDLTGENAAFDAVDSKGRFFSKELHWVSDDGIPMLNKNGTLKTKRRKKNKVAEEPETPESVGMTIEHTGKVLAQYTAAISSGLFGKEFLPAQNNEIDELALMGDAYTQYLATKNIENVPPGVVLLGCLSLYFLPRLTQPVVQEKITSRVKKIVKKILRR